MGHVWIRLNSDPAIRMRQRLITGMYAYGANLGSIERNESSRVLDVWIYHTFLTPIADCRYWFEPSFVQPYNGDASPRDDHAEILLLSTLQAGMSVEEDPDASPPFLLPQKPISGVLDSKANARLLQTISMRLTDPQPETIPSSPVEGTIGEAGNATLGDSAHLRLRIDIPADDILLGRRMLSLRIAFTAP